MVGAFLCAILLAFLGLLVLLAFVFCVRVFILVLILVLVLIGLCHLEHLLFVPVYRNSVAEKGENIQKEK